MTGKTPKDSIAASPQPRRRGSRTPDPDGAPGFAVVGVGASAGGLDAARKLVGALPADPGMAFILVQHLDPSHESMMVDLLASHTKLTVVQATDGALIEPDHIYIIPPGTYLSVGNGALHLSQPLARHGARLPFDHLLHSLAAEYGPRAVCVVLSGTGADGSIGLRAMHERNGLVIAQDPDEAGYDGMPRSAILTGMVDHVLPIAKIPATLAAHADGLARAVGKDAARGDTSSKALSRIIELLRARTSHDFTLYKPGTLQRRIERRMALASLDADKMNHYLEILQSDPVELDLLSKDLLINVTSFFRDPEVFGVLAEKIIPEIVSNATPDRPLRIWIAGCSTGEETYSLTLLFREAMAAANSTAKLQVFASDVDPDAVAIAREGLYPKTIESEVTPERLARFFSREENGYRVLSELRAAVIFTVQDVLADPPFSRLDLVSCRNLLIYLGPVAQAKVISLFHFALREGGILLLGNAETIGNPEGRFEPISKSHRIYRHVGRVRPGDLGFAIGGGDAVRVPMRLGSGQTSRQAALAELCRRLVIDSYAPAAVLINRKHECLYSLGRMDRFLSVVSGHPTQDLLAMAKPAIRIKLRSAIQQAIQANARILVRGGRLADDATGGLFSIDVQPVVNDGESLLLICFVNEPQIEQKPGKQKSAANDSRIVQLEQELEATRAELQGAIRNLEVSSEEQKAINEEALSVNEEFQSTNEELLTSKEELQSLNEELTALNSQLHETLDRQRTTSNDLQNVLYSTDVATIFLDTDLNIRFFTPATRSLFSVIAGDIGRPLADLHSLATDAALLGDART
ncbi:MAG: chemotaxis protein CheB, partial [Mesorhizobium sp.]|nr:chemotaxis protein CheB [Mesorhizobium sp.]